MLLVFWLFVFGNWHPFGGHSFTNRCVELCPVFHIIMYINATRGLPSRGCLWLVFRNFFLLFCRQMPCEVGPWRAVCDEFCVVFCCYYVHTFALWGVPLTGSLWWVFVQYFVVMMYTNALWGFPLGAVCDEFCAVFCCYYVHICLVKCNLDGLSVMSFYVYYVHNASWSLPLRVCLWWVLCSILLLLLCTHALWGVLLIMRGCLWWVLCSILFL